MRCQFPEIKHSERHCQLMCASLKRLWADVALQLKPGLINLCNTTAAKLRCHWLVQLPSYLVHLFFKKKKKKKKKKKHLGIVNPFRRRRNLLRIEMNRMTQPRLPLLLFPPPPPPSLHNSLTQRKHFNSLRVRLVFNSADCAGGNCIVSRAQMSIACQLTNFKISKFFPTAVHWTTYAHSLLRRHCRHPFSPIAST
jgi:hypothetical protein